MKIILLQNVGGIGRQGEVKDVADGHAMNLLIPQRLAEQATQQTLATHSKKQDELAKARAQEETDLKEAVQKLKGSRVELKVRATEKGGLFKTVGPKEIAHALKEQKGVLLPADTIQPLEPIKTIGDHIIKISLPGRQAGAHGAETEMLLKIVAA